MRTIIYLLSFFLNKVGVSGGLSLGSALPFPSSIFPEEPGNFAQTPFSSSSAFVTGGPVYPWPVRTKLTVVQMTWDPHHSIEQNASFKVMPVWCYSDGLAHSRS